MGVYPEDAEEELYALEEAELIFHILFDAHKAQGVMERYCLAAVIGHFAKAETDIFKGMLIKN